jgi:penicillin-binding protein 1A
MAEDLKVQAAPSRAKYKDADYFVEEVRRRGLATLDDRLMEGGYYMRTTLDPRLQTAARVALMDGLEKYDRRHGWRGAWGTTNLAEGWEKAAARKAAPAERRAWRQAAVTSVEGGVRVQPAKDYAPGTLVAEDVAWARAGKGLKVGDLIFVEPSASGAGYRLRQVPAVNGALVAMEPRSGRVLAMVGGYSFSLSNFNRATQAMRQPGSAIKPFVYAAALEPDGGFTPASYVTDAQITFKGGVNGEDWTPENYNKKYYGSMPLRRGLELSRNAMTVRLAQSVGMKKIVALIEKFGIVRSMEPVLAMALGAGETTPFRLTAAYTAFVNNGRMAQPHLIELVQDREGKVIYRADQRECRGCVAGFNGEESPRIPPAGEQIIDPITAFQISSMLEGVVQRGTATQASVLGRPVAGKTGTTNEYRSAWFVGFTHDIVVGVFVGFDDNRSLGEGEAGGVSALPIFVNFMQEPSLQALPPTPFKAPKTATYMVVGGQREAFRPGSEPKTAVVAPKAEGPVSYQEAWPGGKLSTEQVPPPPAPVRPKIPDDLSGLY